MNNENLAQSCFAEAKVVKIRNKDAHQEWLLMEAGKRIRRMSEALRKANLLDESDQGSTQYEGG